jgi:hypothetical protein
VLVTGDPAGPVNPPNKKMLGILGDDTVTWPDTWGGLVKVGDETPGGWSALLQVACVKTQPDVKMGEFNDWQLKLTKATTKDVKEWYDRDFIIMVPLLCKTKYRYR